MKTVKASQVTNLKMVAGNENRISRVIDHGVLREWVAIGWITIRKAIKADFKRYPKVIYK